MWYVKAVHTERHMCQRTMGFNSYVNINFYMFRIMLSTTKCVCVCVCVSGTRCWTQQFTTWSVRPWADSWQQRSALLYGLLLLTPHFWHLTPKNFLVPVGPISVVSELKMYEMYVIWVCHFFLVYTKHLTGKIFWNEPFEFLTMFHKLLQIYSKILKVKFSI